MNQSLAHFKKTFLSGFLTKLVTINLQAFCVKILFSVISSCIYVQCLITLLLATLIFYVLIFCLCQFHTFNFSFILFSVKIFTF